jgi:gliding motility-associated-like protein
MTAQPPETIYPGTVAKTGYADDELYGPFNIGFSFKHFNNPYTQFYVTSNGLVLFTSVPFSPDPADPSNYLNCTGAAVDIPNSALPNNYIAPFWDDLVIDSYGTILYTTIGVSPNRKTIIQFKNMGFTPYPATMGTFSVILYETSNIIQVQYRLIVLSYSGKAHGGNATIGLENAAGTAGVKYAFHNPSGVNSEQAISFTPKAGPSYTMNPDAVYDGVYLTTNLSLPEPSITNLITPPSDAVLGSDVTFEWGNTPNAASYTLYVGTDPDLVGADSYPAGSDLSYNLTGLGLNETYYWGVFSKNATGSTWCEIKRFTTSTLPPLTPVPQTIYVEKPLDKTVKLQYTGGDGSPKTAIVTTLPGHGELYQYNAGVRGSKITSVPAAVTDAGMNIIYAATGNTGNGVGNFNFKLNDSGGDSPERTVTVNVSPASIPHVLYFAKNTIVEIQFDIPMADPTGKQNQFTVKNNGTPLVITSASLKAGDPFTIELTTSTSPSGTVLISYTQGDVEGLSGGLLLPFTDQPVTLTAQTVTFSQSLAKKYTDSPLVLIASASSSLGITWSSSNLSVATISGNNATFHTSGTSDITARQAGNATYAPAKYIKTLTVAKGDQTITFSPLTAKTFGDADFTVSAVAGSSLPVTLASNNTSVATVTGDIVHITGAGTAVITASQPGNTAWNAAPDVQQTLTVSKAAAIVSFGSMTTIYNGIPQAATATTNPAGLNVDFTYNGSSIIPVNAGSYAVVATITDNNYQGTNSGTLIIGKAALTATADNKTKIYGEINPALTITYTGFAGSDNETVLDTPPVVATTALQGSDAGTYPVTVTGGSDNNYSFACVNGTLAIIKATLTITAENKTKIYGDANPSLTVLFSGFIGTEDVTVLDTPPLVTTTSQEGSDTGEYPITVSGASDNNYLFVYIEGNLTVTKAPLSVIADDKFKTYGDANPVLTLTYSGFKGTDDYTDIDIPPIAVTNGLQSSDAGTYPITPSGGVDNNYTLSYTDGILTILKADQSITFLPLPGKTYGDADFSVSASSGSSLPVSLVSGNPAVAAVSGNIIHIIGAGTTVITASQGGSVNYNAATDVLQTLTVNKAPLTFTADNKAKEYNSQNPVLTYTITGFVGTDDEGDLDILPVITTTCTQSSAAGSYPVTVSGGSDNNYNYTYVPGTLVVTKILQTITFTGFPEKLLAGDTFTLTATSSSGLPVQFESGDPQLATITGDLLKGVAKGNVQIRAFSDGDVNFEPAEAFATVEIYNTHKDIMNLFTPNNDGINDYWELPNLAEWGKCDVKVYSRSGKLVYANSNYNNLWDGMSNGNPVPEGAYYFIIKTQNAGEMKGTVNIVR